jgi:SAM-dependent methyltransferase
MLNFAKEKLDDASIEFRVEDAQNLSFADNTFDVVVFQFGLMFLPDKQKGLAEAFRVLKPGGTLIFSTWEKTQDVPLLKVIFNDTILPHFKKEDAPRLLVPFSLHNPLLLKTWLEESGFDAIKTDKVVLGSGCPTSAGVVDAFFRKHSIGQGVLDDNPALFETIAAAMEQAITAAFGSSDLHFELAAFLTSGQKPVA